MLYEEYEALRLCDYDGYNQCDASKLMEVSRPTLTRICMSARNKVAIAIVEGRQLIIEGGKVEIDSGWMKCSRCLCFFVKIENEDCKCPLCGSNDVTEVRNDEEESGHEMLLSFSCGHGKRRRCHEHTNHKIYHI
jgi:Zn finger protein HypA/HybF involved in hydrogenase expression